MPSENTSSTADFGDRVSPYEALRPLMDICGATTSSAEQFYWEVNSAYHEAEAPYYEQMHSEMFARLREKWATLVSPLLTTVPRSIQWLDIGCGTGLVGQQLAVLLGKRISRGVLLDPSARMVEECRKRARSWPFETEFVVETVDALPFDSQFGLVTINSVLHHIVEIDAFCRRVASLVERGGYLMTCQDPPGEPTSLFFHVRHANFHGVWRWGISNVPAPMKKCVKHAWGRVRVRRPASKLVIAGPDVGNPELDPVTMVIAETNRKLAEKGVIIKPLTAVEVWAVTDYHYPGQPGGFGRGIRLDLLKKHLSPMRLDKYFTYTDSSTGLMFGSRWEKCMTELRGGE